MFSGKVLFLLKHFIILSLYKLANVQTKAGELSIDEAKEIIEPMLESSETFLLANGFNYQEDFDEGDPNIVITALALMECGLYSDAACIIDLYY